MTKNIQNHIDSLTNKKNMQHLDLSNWCYAGKINLEGFTNLKTIDISNNKFTDLNFLFNLPNRMQLEGVNLFGNEIETLDFSRLLTTFSNLNYINLENNPLNGSILDNQALLYLKELMDKKKLKVEINFRRGTLLLDSLKYINSLKKENELFRENQKTL
ncbi:hypothetical protein [endosymbiont GvMRE of Glomus versiforme]|uniref:hypothetical protein n=1 Tax=endosymbiont GvMRE of Glomus versiforme TaxID=2039283 RepID=UPI000EEB634F|nr:hypothetical protein [endosymbiont GvMRE of Glomus versiforme]RHZ35702.1 hypothetical protein GvMRE_IIg100 [endosymbiont GvMRE of Glomus versiforme]